MQPNIGSATSLRATSLLTFAALAFGTVASLAQAPAPAPTPAPAPDGRAPTIVGGEPTTIERHPWQVALLRRAAGGEELRFSCGGSIVHAEWILTAAHCVASVDGGRVVVVSEAEVVVGTGSADRRTLTHHEVAQVIVHESYAGTATGSDIALLKLKVPVTGRPIELAPTDFTLTPGDKLELTGWGRTDMAAQQPSANILQRISLPYISLETCRRPLTDGGQGPGIRPDMLCVGSTPGHGQCAGDSGGPLVRHTPTGVAQVGIVSFSSRPCTTRFGVFTRVSAFRDWIAQQMAFK